MNLDLGRMKKAIAGERFLLPDGLSKEEIRQHILATAAKIKEARAMKGDS